MTDLFRIDSLSGIFIDGITFDNRHQKYYINGLKPTGAKGIFIVDIKNQSTKFNTIASSIGGLQYDKNLDKVVCLDWSGSSHALSTIDSNGILAPIGTIQTVISSITPGRFAYDPQKHFYIFCGRDAGGTDHLYTINTANANVVNSPSYPTPSKGGNPQFDNLVFPIHDENLDITYALFWEAITKSDTTADTTLTIDIIPKQLKTECVIAPNAFSPNGDGRNDVFCAKAICNTRKFNMQVFNRRGQKVFESENIREGWDGNLKGSPAGMDTYVYMIQYQTDTSEPQTLQGNISLIR
jgi:gliding motility-associated-like protein